MPLPAYWHYFRARKSKSDLIVDVSHYLISLNGILENHLSIKLIFI